MSRRAGAGDWPSGIDPLGVDPVALHEAVALTDASATARAAGEPARATALGLEALGTLGLRLEDLLATPPSGSSPLDDEGVADVVTDLLDATLGRPTTLLATYGTLRPGRDNHHVVADLGGTWAEGTVHGELVDWGGYPVLRWHRSGEPISVSVLRADALVGAWDRLDAFETPRYRRRPVTVELADGGWAVATAYVDAHVAGASWRSTSAEGHDGAS